MKRPGIEYSMILSAAKRLAEDSTVIHGDDEQEEYAKDIAKEYRYGMDGYQLASNLERNHMYLPTVGMVEELDNMEYFVDEIHSEACKKWADWCNIKPPFPVGTIISKGEITGISDRHVASYLVKPIGQVDEQENHRRFVIKFEDARLPECCQAA